jgi:CRISPR-associated endonuclease/helicase Cas3
VTKRTPYPYQETVGRTILQGKSVILQAPTGAGKTTAALLPFLHARNRLAAAEFPRKCIYSVPMRVLANQFYAEYSKLIRQYGWEHTLNVTIQTGDQPDDQKLGGDLVFTTIDQTLSNFLNIPYALGTGSANLNAGALVSSYLVFDELHLYDPDVMLPTVLEMLRMLRGVTPFVVMTATFSTSMLDRLATLLDAVVVPEDAHAREEMQKIGSQVGKTRRFHALDAPLTAERVLAARGSARRIICICNTVRAAQQLYRDIDNTLNDQGDTVTQRCLLHARFYKTDRDQKEQWVREQFGIAQSEYDGPPLILVATQVIEVGVDATCDVLHTEVAPAASILQRAGRCARRAHETGEVYVYLPRTDEGEPDFAPYYLPSQPKRTDRGRRLCEATWTALLCEDFQGRSMSFAEEQQLIDRVHTPIDQEVLDSIADRQRSRRDDMLRTMRDLDKGMAPDLIRDINTRFVVIHDDPESDVYLRRNPWYYDGFALYPGALAQAFNNLTQIAPADTPWLMQSAERLDGAERDAEEAPSRQSPEYRWCALLDSQEVFSSAVIAVHPSLVRYDAAMGFEFGLSEARHTLRKRSGKRTAESYSYRKETYAEHVAGLFRAYRYSLADPATNSMRLALADEIAYCAHRLESNPAFQLTPGRLDRVLRVIFACHDLGKLNVQWQAWAHKWQQRVGKFYGGEDRTLPPTYMAAHTDFDPTDEQKAAQKKLGKRPPHAGESAMAAGNLLYLCCGEHEGLCRAAMTAIARHHHAASDSHRPFVSHPFAQQAFQEALNVVGLEAERLEEVFWQVGNEDSLQNYLVNFDARSVEEVLLYFVLVRVLRLADQRSQI